MVLYATEKFRPYLLCSKVIKCTDQSTLKHLLGKKDCKPHLLRWILLLQEFGLEIWDKKGIENVVVNHLSHLPISFWSDRKYNLPIDKSFPNDHLHGLATLCVPWYGNLVNYLDMNSNQKKRFFYQAKSYFWE